MRNTPDEGPAPAAATPAALRLVSPVPFPAEDSDAARRLSERMRALGIECPIERTTVAGTLVLEPPLRVPTGVRNLHDTWIGAFSYSWSPISSAVRSIGRYCSIAGDVTFGELEHPTGWLSTSSFTYDSGWMWEEFAASQGREHRPVAYPNERKHPPVTVGNDVWIGLGAYIRGGVHLGSGCIVGARAVVSRDVPPYAVVVGNPARVVRYRFDEHTVEALLELQWWRHAFTDLAGLPFDDVGAAISAISEMRARNALPDHSPVCLQLLGGLREAAVPCPVRDTRGDRP